ncbi:hypothetical protein VTP01DRAFT_10214 [Rhizomucor pusillus]|uniref:uncharacterized protein n=1 Tax=Rhizomucor pusillus TaxID=4840 RepID=UPI0037449128
MPPLMLHGSESYLNLALSDSDPPGSDLKYRQPCNTPLLHPSTRQPIKFPYSSIIDNLQLLFARPGFEQEINHWRQRVVLRHSFFDVYDGAVWNPIPEPDDPEMPFVQHRPSILFTLNVEWFRPFRTSQYSCGAVYLTINNLPRSQRFKTNNIILVGVIPGLKEPKKNRRGIDMKTYEHPGREVKVRAALMMVATAPKLVINVVDLFMSSLEPSS